MANLGDRLLQPEEGWKRIDDTNLNIKYNGSDWVGATSDVVYNKTSHYCEKNQNSSYIEFYFYGTKLRIIDLIFSNRCEITNITIDENIIEQYSTKNTNTDDSDRTKVYQLLVYEKLNLDKKIHKCKIYTNNTVGLLSLDCIDIDEDGYMLHCDNSGNLHYDVTPIMTSNTTPSPYVASASSEYTSNYKAYNAFNGSLLLNYDSFAPNGKTGWLKLNFGKITRINSFLIGTSKQSLFNSEAYPKNFELYGSNNDLDYTLIKEFKNIGEWTAESCKILNLNKNAEYQYYKLNISKIGETTWANITELRYLLSVDTPFYLIKDNTSNKVYNYNEENNTLVEVDNVSILKEDALNNACIYNLNKAIPLLDTLSDDLTIICNNNEKIVVNGIKNNNSMIVAKAPFSTRLAKNIDYFELTSNVLGNSYIKMAVSVDEGTTWKVWDNNSNNFVDLTNKPPLKKYEELAEGELIQWNTFRDEVLEKGIDNKTINTIDFNSIKTDNMMFAYVFNRDSYSDSCEMNKLQYQFDANGTYTLLKDSEVDIKQSASAISVVPKNDIELMKINIANASSSGDGINNTIDTSTLATKEELQINSERIDEISKKADHNNRDILDLLSTDGQDLYFKGKNVQKVELEDGKYGYSSTFIDVTTDTIYNIDTSNGSRLCDQIVQVWEFEEGDTDITTVAKTFDNAYADNFYYDGENGIEITEDVCKIKDSFELYNSLNSDGFYESEVISKANFLAFIGIEER